VVDDFNKQYGAQIKKMEKQVNKTGKAIADSTNIPASANAKNFNNIKQYNNALKDAERILRSKVPEGQGLFRSVQNKDALGNLNSFVAELERANGVVERVRYQWDKEAQNFTPINRQTINSLQKHVDKASQTLGTLRSDINKLREGEGQSALLKEYDELEKRIANGTLTQKSVQGLQTKIKNEQALQQVISRQNKDY